MLVRENRRRTRRGRAKAQRRAVAQTHIREGVVKIEIGVVFLSLLSNHFGQDTVPHEPISMCTYKPM